MEKHDGMTSFFQEIYKKSNKIIEALLIFYFILGLLLAVIHNTWWVGIGVGALTLSLYAIAKFAFPKTNLNQYMASACFAVFMAQFIYQMQGLFEMHFIAFIGIIALISYQNWRIFIPLTSIVIVHHASLAYTQYLGVVNENEAFRNVFFTQLEYTGLETFLFHTGLFGIAAAIAGYYAYELEKNTRKNASNIFSLKASGERIHSNIEFANHIANADFDVEYEIEEDDEMGSALLNMRKNLMEGAERERNEKFMNVGIAEISNIIRDNKTGLGDLSFEIISYLVQYLEANQGGMFVIKEEDNEKYLELSGCYAFERKKFLEKRVSIGEGLVGQCVLEKETTYMTDIPERYINITSGLGKAVPRNLVIVPLKNDQVIEGVIEIASFQKIEKHHIEFLEKLGEIIAASITNTRINERTQKLYQNSQEQAEQLRSQEEEMRQNMEELTATQEEMRRNAFDLERRMEAIHKNGTTFVEFDIYGNVLDADESFCQLVKYSLDEIKGKNNKLFMEPGFANSDKYKQIWEGFKQSIVYTGEYVLIAKDGSEIFVVGSYSVILDKNNEPSKVLNFAFNISHVKKENSKASIKEKDEEREIAATKEPEPVDEKP